ncbi:MAG: ATPase, T2SS/T4P/T4SS family [Gammaproteobacteria bacterium]|jgi:MSHA biogenesis protein MshE|nr:ATPase, T2SS/T4P/T4SS family [Gammaproteobacteria bacterium]MDH3749596.1 ATPase, T2SS/T4P/T4SS family [Gammaproteobacteria bacterium]MDH3804056.1 ATPase, T2SS/T4P/T4SS family [Gammaproteobacteria bacterium]
MSKPSAAVSRISRRKKLRLGELLLEAGAITQDQLEQALTLQKQTGHKLGRALTEVGAIEESELYKFLAKRLEIDYLDLSSIKLQADTVMLLPEVQARRLRALVLKREKEDLLVGMADPTDIFAHDELHRLLGKNVNIALVNETELLRTIDIMYRRTDEINALAAEVKEDLGEARIDIDQLTADEDSAEAPVIKLLQSMFRDAVQVSASDIHIEPDEFVLRIRQRVDGVLQEHVIDGRGVASALVTRLKLMSGLDISEKRLPQDGRFSIRVHKTTLDIRVSTLPVQFGESIVLRLLDHSANLLSLEKLGMPQDVLDRFYRMIERPSGMVLVTGPTGSGKTTTLYSALNYVNKPATKIITVEDPVEYRLERINQVQVHTRIGLDFGRVLRTALRQDPDIILVGEMRDRETVDIGLRAAMTGHLVFSTLHTVNAMATASRLLDMGAPGYLIGAALQGIVAQRLVRRVCESCAEPIELSPGQSTWLKAQVGSKRSAKPKFVRGRGCNYCQLTGYRGRIGVYEMLEMDDGLTDALRREELSEFVSLASKKRSYVPLVNCALDYAVAGVTSLEEVIRIAGGLDGDDETVVDEAAAAAGEVTDG